MIGGGSRELDLGTVVREPQMEGGVVRGTTTRHFVGTNGGEMVATAPLGALLTKEVGEAEINAGGVTDAFHLGEAGRDDLTFFEFLLKIGDGERG